MNIFAAQLATSNGFAVNLHR